MRELFVEKVIDTTGEFLDNNQRIKLKEILTEICLNYHIEILEQSQKQEIQKNNEEILNKFISSKEIEGCSVRTLKYYKDNITKMLDTVNLPINEITTETLRNYLSNYKNNTTAGMVTIDNIRRTLSSFFAWLENEDYIVKSPVRRIHKVKATKKVKETLTDENLEKLRDTCSNEILIRNLGKDANINKVHPHKFRRTMATMAIDKGMPIEQVQKLLGHIKIDTTMEYAMVNQNNVKNSHRKYIT